MSGSMTIERPTPAMPAPEDTVREWRAVDVPDGESLSAADVLRLLDWMRHELSVRVVGHSGAFIGYDALTVSPGIVSGPAQVIVEARLRSRSERLHDVEYVAVSAPAGAEGAGAADALLARGTGRTLHVAC